MTDSVGITRIFSYGSELGQPLYVPDLSLSADDSAVGRTQVNHLQKKILTLRERMYTEAGRQIANERHEYVAEFVERFEREAAGEV